MTVNCYALGVTKDTDASFTTTCTTWAIDKSSDDINGHNLLLNVGQTYDYIYEVTVTNTGSSDSAWAVEGDIDVHNPAPIDATLNSVSDVISGPIVADVDCGVTFPYTLVAGGTLECTYSADLPNANARTNTATATLQNHAYDHDSARSRPGRRTSRGPRTSRSRRRTFPKSTSAST